MSRFDPLSQRCPICRDALEVVAARHGVVLACLRCQGGATTLAVLRKVAPRELVNHLWQSAQKHGVPGSRLCPSCANPLLELTGPNVSIQPRVDVCVPCYFVWLDAEALSHVSVAEPKAAAEAREALLRVAVESEVVRELRKARSEAIAEAVIATVIVAS